MIPRTITLTPRTVAVVMLAACMAVLGTAFAVQYIGGLQPCVLCIWQRWPYAIVIALAVVALALDRRRATAAIAGAAGAVLLAGAGIAAFHVGVEQLWWEGTAACTGTVDLDASTEDIAKALLAAPVVRCDQIPWSLFGISMAGYNFLLSLGLAAGAVWAAWRLSVERTA